MPHDVKDKKRQTTCLLMINMREPGEGKISFSHLTAGLRLNPAAAAGGVSPVSHTRSLQLLCL